MTEEMREYKAYQKTKKQTRETQTRNERRSKLSDPKIARLKMRRGSCSMEIGRKKTIAVTCQFGCWS